MLIKFFFYLYSIINLVLINIYLFIKKINSKKKIIFFYHPKENLTKMHTYYVEDFLAKFKGYDVLFGAKILLFRHFYIKESLLSYIYNVDIFVAPNIIIEINGDHHYAKCFKDQNSKFNANFLFK